MTEPIYVVKEVAKRYRKSPRTIRDWINKGCAGPDGRRVHLDASRMGNNWQMSESALAVFEMRLRGFRGESPKLDLD